MRIVLDTDKKTITVPWNYGDKVAEIRATAERFNPALSDEQRYSLSFIGYIDTLWKECIVDSDKCVKTADKPKSRK